MRLVPDPDTHPAPGEAAVLAETVAGLRAANREQGRCIQRAGVCYASGERLWQVGYASR